MVWLIYTHLLTYNLLHTYQKGLTIHLNIVTQFMFQWIFSNSLSSLASLLYGIVSLILQSCMLPPQCYIFNWWLYLRYGACSLSLAPFLSDFKSFIFYLLSFKYILFSCSTCTCTLYTVTFNCLNFDVFLQNLYFILLFWCTVWCMHMSVHTVSYLF